VPPDAVGLPPKVALLPLQTDVALPAEADKGCEKESPASRRNRARMRSRVLRFKVLEFYKGNKDNEIKRVILEALIKDHQNLLEMRLSPVFYRQVISN
jgi:hypothetical protein